MVWRSGGVLHADPHLPACVGAAPLGLVLGLVFNHSPDSIQARWETLSVQQDSCLWWRVRVTDTAPNAPMLLELDLSKREVLHLLAPLVSSYAFGFMTYHHIRDVAAFRGY